MQVMKDGRAGSPMESEGQYAEEGKPSRRRRRREETEPQAQTSFFSSPAGSLLPFRFGTGGPLRN